MKSRGDPQLGTELHVCSVQAETKWQSGAVLMSWFIPHRGDSVNRKQRLTHISKDLAPNALKRTSNE